jgi:transcriptional regulator with GAF, ATPase, and Fis domain
LEHDDASSRFRRDLFYRLSVFPIQLPPLRERPEDIRPLAMHFLDQAARRYGRRTPRLTAAACRALETYGWPGNIRELQHVIERAVLLTRGETLQLDGIVSEPETRRTRAAALEPETARHVIPEIEWRRRERDNIGTALERANGRIYGPDGAAAMLGVKPTTLMSRIKALGLGTAG